MSEGKRLEEGLKGESRAEVTRDRTALAMGSGEIEVFATPAMVALMESAAVQCVKGALGPGETSVGVRLDIAHSAATPVGGAVRAEALLEKIEGRRLFFQVTAFDDKEKIGEGKHERFIVDRERFMSKVSAKKP